MKRSRHHTGWSGALGVASELSRRGYDAAITLGNTPSLDLICSSPGRKRFTVQVKSNTTKTWVRIRKEALELDPQPDLFFAFVFIPTDSTMPLEYCILTSAEIHEAYLRQPKVRRDGQPYKLGSAGIAWREVQPHASRWDKLPQ
ncbi:MAG TPA: hypothetical protein VFD50_02105 [Thermoleophilia bacterium]|nr:hypothetical protein [Thermoleophilia bacterium]